MPSPQCPCDSKKPLARCCGPYLAGSSIPKTVKQLMRSRYSAFALGGHGAYLLATWHPSTAPAVSAEALDAVEQEWAGLSVLNFSQEGNTGTVEFAASYRDHNGDIQIHHELSRFRRIDGRWLYLDAKPEQH